MTASVSFSEAVEDASRGNSKLPQASFLSDGPFPVVDQGRQLVAGFSDDASLVCKVPAPVIVFGDHTRALKYIDFPFVMGADGVKVLRVRAGWDPKFVFHYLRFCDIPSAGYSRHFKFLKEVRVPQPPLDEQRRIAAILDQADALRAKRRQALEHLDDLSRSIFLDMFGDPLANDLEFDRAAIGSVAVVVTGNSPSRADSANFGDDIEWIKSDNLGDTIATRAQEWLSPQGRRKARTAPPGSVLVTCIAGSPASIGKASMVDREVAFNQQINAVLPSDRLDTTFLLAQFKASPSLVRSKSTGGMKGLVSKSAFQSIEILLPSVGLQREFAVRAERVGCQRTRAQRAATAADDLFASLQDVAFSGRL